MDAEPMVTQVLVWLANYSLHSTILFGVVAVGTRAMPERHDAVSEILWKCALLTSIVSPLLASFSPVAALAPRIGVLDSIGVPTQSSDPGPIPIGRVLIALWIAGSVAGLVNFTRRYRALLRTIDDRRRLTPAEVSEHLGLDPSSGIFTCSNNIQVPIAFGNEVCLPSWALATLAREQLRTVVAHELAHIKRRDAAWRWTAAIVSRVFFFQPFNRLAARKLRELAECLCDEAALAESQSPVALASALSAVAGKIAVQERRALALQPAFASNESLTVRRVRRALTAPLGAKQSARRTRQIAATVCSAILILFAAFAPAFGAAVNSYIITAEDPAGPFTLTVERGRVVAASIAGRTLQTHEVRQRGSALELPDPRGGHFQVNLTPKGGITWTPRLSTIPTR